MRNLSLAALAILAAPLPSMAAVLPPVDEAGRNAAFFTFRAQLVEALIRRDEKAVLAAVNENIRNSFGGDDGVEAFREKWFPPGRESDLWTTLGEVLALGGSFDDYGNFAAPYVYAEWPEDVDAYTHVAVTGSNVNVRAAPSLDGAVVASVSFVILERATPGVSKEWVHVRLPGGNEGYVFHAYVRSPIDYRAIFRKIDGRWQLAAFVAGD